MLKAGKGPPLVLLHGFCGAARGWQALVDALSDRFHVIAPDWPGFGESTDRTPLPSVQAMAAWVVSIAHRMGLERFSVLGHSMSGYVVQTLLRDHEGRVDRAVLYGAGLADPAAARFESLERTIERLERDGAEATARRVCATWFVEGDGAVGYRGCVADGAQMDVAAGIAALRACKGIDFSGTLRAVGRDVLVVLGDRDRTFQVTDAIALREALPKARLCVMPGCAHAAHLEAPKLFADVLRSFLEEPHLMSARRLPSRR
jgi:pimeloyl-ACP methyl ester carboxylesterase